VIRFPFVVRVAALASAFVVPISAAIAFTLVDNAHVQRLVRVEMRGAGCFSPVYSSLLALERYRAAPSSPSAAGVERSFTLVESSGCRLDPAAWGQIRSAWPAAAREPNGLSALEDRVVAYVGTVSKDSNLRYDGNRAIVDLGDALAYQLPGAAARFTLAATTHDPLGAARLDASARDRLRYAFDDLAAALAEYPPYRPKLTEPLRRAESLTRTPAAGSLNSLFFAGTNELERILAQKIAVLEERRGTIEAIAAAAFTLSLLIVFAIAATIARRDRRALSEAEARAALLQAELGRKGAEEALHRNEARFRSIFAASPLPMAITGLDGRVSEWNDAYAQLTGPESAPAGRMLLESFALDPPAELEVLFEKIRSDGAGVRVADFPVTSRAGRQWYHAIVSSVPDAGGSPSYCTVMLQDVTERTNREQQLHHQATHDTMTGLPNRSFVIAALQRALERRRGGPRFALFFVDVDNFKTINDSLGHAAGDEYLRIIAQRLSACVRTGDVVARYGGDEFAILLGNVPTAADVEKIVSRIGREFAEPIRLAGTALNASLSIGIVVDDGIYASGSAAIADADLAMYRAKARGGNRSVAFRRGPDEDEADSA
jgi:diguanylate cyclase (GGDEF)-like protein/PAS domain S-box-containing protein